MKTLKELGILAKNAESTVAFMGTEEKNYLLREMAEALIKNQSLILEMNQKDIEFAKEKGMSEALLDRLVLNEARISDMAEGLLQVTHLEDPIGKIEHMWKNKDGLTLGKMAVPLGVILMIYEARPNVTIDTIALCVKSGNVALLRGSSSAFYSNQCMVNLMRDVIERLGYNPDIVQLVEDLRYEAVIELLKMNDYIDLAIPRGGESLIQTVVRNATVPVIETGVGLCHLYIDKDANLDNAVNIMLNGKVQRPGVCNAIETMIVHQDIAESFLAKALPALFDHNVEVRGCEKTMSFDARIKEATNEDYSTEYKSLILSVIIVENINEAFEHITQYSSKHTEVIVSDSYEACMDFVRHVDAACVNVNASSRFSDGFQYGFGAEIGISTQKMHARGPMGLLALTSYKYVVLGSGQVRQ